jgi:hypothetical protein
MYKSPIGPTDDRMTSLSLRGAFLSAGLAGPVGCHRSGRDLADMAITGPPVILASTMWNSVASRIDNGSLAPRARSSSATWPSAARSGRRGATSPAAQARGGCRKYPAHLLMPAWQLHQPLGREWPSECLAMVQLAPNRIPIASSESFAAGDSACSTIACRSAR